jgi:DNA polymerase-1
VIGPARRLLLLDGHAILYRAFFAIRALSTRAGQPTNAVFGFVRMLGQLTRVWRPAYAGVVFDGGLSPQRMALLPEYKANRPAMPDALRGQLPLVEEYLDAAGIQHVRRAGEEADDVLASLATRAADGLGEVLIATSDKDMMQLVDARIGLVPVSGGGDRMGPEQVRAKAGVAPGQIVDWLALVGDASDNIPGVPGIGPKTAVRLLAEFGSVSELLRRPEAIASEKVREALAAHRALLERNLQMVRLRTDLPAPASWDEWRMSPPESGRLLAYFDRLEFHALAREHRQGDLFGSP